MACLEDGHRLSAEHRGGAKAMFCDLKKRIRRPVSHEEDPNWGLGNGLQGCTHALYEGGQDLIPSTT